MVWIPSTAAEVRAQAATGRIRTSQRAIEWLVSMAMRIARQATDRRGTLIRRNDDLIEHARFMTMATRAADIHLLLPQLQRRAHPSSAHSPAAFAGHYRNRYGQLPSQTLRR
jgi:hypothetical protein